MLKMGHPDFRPYDITQFNITDFNYFSVDISVLCPSTSLADFKRNISRLNEYSDDPEHIEVLVKLDSDNRQAKEYVTFLMSLRLRWKIVVYSKGNGYNDLHVFYNDLARLSFGNSLWLFNDYTYVDTPHWDSKIRSERNKFNDNIYVLYVNGTNQKRTRSSVAYHAPIVSQELYLRLGMVGINRKYADFFYRIGKVSNRILQTDVVICNSLDPHEPRFSSSLHPYEECTDKTISDKVKELNIT